MTWKAVAGVADVWSAEVRPRACWSLRSVALRLADRSLLIVSPTKGMGEAAHQALKAIGSPRLLLAPNYFHHLGIDEFLERYPEASVLASNIAATRLQKKLSAPVAGLDELRAQLPKGVSVIEPPGTKNGETWLAIETEGECAWVVGDAFFNVSSPPTGLYGAVLKVTKTTPGLCLGSTFRWLALRDRDAYVAWLLKQLRQRPPSVLIVCHGEAYTEPDLAARLTHLVRERLGGPEATA